MPGKGAIVSRRQLAVSLLAGVAVALVAVGVASGGQGPFAYTYEMGTVANNSLNDATSPGCQSPTVGGGVYLSGSDLGAEVNSSYPYDSPGDANLRPDDAWQGFGINDGSGGTYSMRVDVICAQGVPLVYRDKSFEIAPNSHRTGRRGCPGDTVVVSGGVRVDNGGLDDELVASFPYDDGDSGNEPEDGWAGTANAVGPGGLTVFAICSPVHNFRYVKRSETGAPDDQYTIRAPCRNAERVAGGGAKVSKPGQNAEIASLHPFDDDDADQQPDDGYQGWANNQGPAADRKLTSFAICL